MAFNFSPKIVTDGLVLYLDATNTKSYVSGSTAWNDLTVSSRNANLINTPAFVQTFGGYINFDGADDYGDFGTDLPINGLSSFTIGVWVRIALNSSPTYFARYNSFPGALPNNIDFVGQIAGTTDPRIRCVWGTASNFTQWVGTTDTIIRNQWKYITFVVNNPASNVIGYVDGNSVPLSSSSTGTGAGSTIGATSPISWNIASIILGTGVRQYFTFNLPNLQVYNRALSAQEVLQNYNALKSRYNL